jgi:hypothetical protein
MLKKNNLTYDEFMGNVYDATIKTVLAGKFMKNGTYTPPHFHSSKFNAFHYMSLDFAIDTSAKIYLLEVNHSPTLHYKFAGRTDVGLHRRRKIQISGALTLAGYQLPPTLSLKARVGSILYFFKKLTF